MVRLVHFLLMMMAVEVVEALVVVAVDAVGL